MGNSASTQLKTYVLPHLWKQDEPDSFAPYKYDAEFGFEEKPRPEMVSNVSKLEMDSCMLEHSVRDLCARQRINFRGCIKRHNPFWGKCTGYLNELDLCYAEERIHDMKEYERERRLNARERRIKKAQGEEAWYE